MKWYPKWAGDFVVKTRHLSLMEQGAYNALLDHYYTTEVPLPAELESLCQIVGARKPEEEKAVRRVVAEFFPLNGDGLRHNKRADEEILKAQSKSKSSRKAAHKRWDSRS